MAVRLSLPLAVTVFTVVFLQISCQSLLVNNTRSAKLQRVWGLSLISLLYVPMLFCVFPSTTCKTQRPTIVTLKMETQLRHLGRIFFNCLLKRSTIRCISAHVKIKAWASNSCFRACVFCSRQSISLSNQSSQFWLYWHNSKLLNLLMLFLVLGPCRFRKQFVSVIQQILFINFWKHKLQEVFRKHKFMVWRIKYWQGLGKAKDRKQSRRKGQFSAERKGNGMVWWQTHMQPRSWVTEGTREQSSISTRWSTPLKARILLICLSRSCREHGGGCSSLLINARQ